MTTDVVLNFIFERKNIKNIVEPNNIEVPKSGWIKTNARLAKETDKVINKFWLDDNDFARNNTSIIFKNSEGCKKKGIPIFERSYHLRTPKIGFVNLKPNKSNIDIANNGLINL